MRRFRIIILAGIVVAVAETPASAQTAREDSALLFAPAFIKQEAWFGDDAPRKRSGAAATLGLIARTGRTGASALTFEATVQMSPLENPYFKEYFLPVAAQAGVQIGRRVYVRPSGGIAFQGGGVAPVLGVAIGFERTFGHVLGGSEFIVRASGVAGLAGWVAGVQVPMGKSVASRLNSRADE